MGPTAPGFTSLQVKTTNNHKKGVKIPTKKSMSKDHKEYLDRYNRHEMK